MKTLFTTKTSRTPSLRDLCGFVVKPAAGLLEARSASPPRLFASSPRYASSESLAALKRGAVLALLLCGAALAACGQDANGVTLVDVPGGDIQEGERAIGFYGCGACHVIPGVPGAHGAAGPPLTAFARRSYIAGSLPNTPDNLIAWLENPQAIEPGTAMPNLGVSQYNARHIAAYLATLR